MCLILWAWHLYALLIVAGGQRVSEIDGLIEVTQQLDLVRMKNHVRMWKGDSAMQSVLGEKMTNLLLAHHAMEVNMLANTLLAHMGEEEMEGDKVRQDVRRVESAVAEPEMSKDAKNSSPEVR